MRRSRGRPRRSPITWVDNSGCKPAPFARKLPRFTNAEINVPDGYAEHLYAGAVWLIVVPMYAVTEPGALPSLRQFASSRSRPIAAGSIVIYAGSLRQDERTSTGRIVSVSRPSFIVDDLRCIVNDFTCLMPLQITGYNGA